MAKSSGVINLISGQVTQFRNSLEIAKSQGNYYVMVQTLIEMGNLLPAEARFNGKLFRELWDQAEKDCPKCIYEKEQLDINDKKNIRTWYAANSKLVMRAISDYVKNFYERVRSSI